MAVAGRRAAGLSEAVARGGRRDDDSRARDLMLEATDRTDAPWHIVRSDDEKRARSNRIAPLPSRIPRRNVAPKKLKLPKRSRKVADDDPASLEGRRFVPENDGAAIVGGCL
ncbi:MAG TPA: hypothetical protein VIA45_11005 [Thermoanaerobaculia bacterium]